MRIIDFWITCFCLSFCLYAQLLNCQNLTCDSQDLKALQGFLSGITSGISGWGGNLSSNCCNWPGVTCNSSSSLRLTGSSISGRVVELNLNGRRLSGKLSDSLGDLDQLRTLNLSRNSLRGPLPYTLLHLPNLVALDLRGNDFSGEIPATINLPSVQTFDVSENFFRGQVPVSICSNSSQIRILSLSLNYFSGNLPPGFGNCSRSLQRLCVGSNLLNGTLPEDIFLLGKLNRLDIQDNQFSGKLSSRIGNLSNLLHLDISSNMLYGDLPDVFHSFKNLTDFIAQSNNFTGMIPRSLSNSPTISLLNLRNNSFNGEISLNCTAMTQLVSLDLGTNQFFGSIPDNLPSCRKLTAINLAKSNLGGQIPDSFKNFPSLSYLSLSNSSFTNLTSALGILQQCKNLTTLVLTMNFQGEELVAERNFHFENLKVLIIANCKLSGSVPYWLMNSTDLQLLDLSWNHLTGVIPSWLGNFKSLFYLDLSNNTFTGEIPISLAGLQSLIFRNISLEQPAPDFPFFMKRNQSARGLQYNKVWSLPPTLDLSSNFLVGPIWPEFGNLRKLHVLDLKFNNLSGTIPSNLSGMTSIEMLDLSHNNLTGSIPSSLIELSFLSKFNVAYNRLSGPIPSGGQFATFPNSSFDGNLNLCGEHYYTSCRDNSHTDFNSARKSKRNKGAIIGMAIGIVLGMIFILAVVFLILMRTTCSRRRGIDPVREDSTNSSCQKDFKELGSQLVVLFRNKEDLSIEELLKSTNNFDQANIIGCGGFGLVYRATLPDGRKVAIKRLSGDCGQMDREFQAEVETLSQAQHPNLVLLQGYCRFKNDRLLIYSYMENSSLDYWLHEKPEGASSLDWDTRLQIAQGAAHGLAYLHQSCDPHILHRDIKSSNILLDENFEAHLADFGLARLIRPYDTHVTTDLVGTLGYIPPEYGQAPVATYKGDVYSFGVVLLELLTGKRPMDVCKPRGCRDLISWVMQMRRDKRESEVFDPFIYDKENESEMRRVFEIACLCLSESPKVRPSTQQLVTWLDDIDLVNIPNCVMGFPGSDQVNGLTPVSQKL